MRELLQNVCAGVGAIDAVLSPVSDLMRAVINSCAAESFSIVWRRQMRRICTVGAWNER